ncbi:MAG TPA: hypothetical protein ENH10_00765 [Bacteroidetes bacterium]|nr:hypothetical protein [Bacteroidota bacterium]HEX03675.1 hypothetical protein [Bacteroidota bacterium]
MITTLKIIQLIAVLSGLVAVFTLFHASIGVPWDMQSWKGQTEVEQAWQSRQLIMKWIGLPAAVISAGCQIAAIFWATT